MENWGLVTYREVDLLIDAHKASSQQKQRVAVVVTHELAHQWFGNLVTMQWWDDLWLNEGEVKSWPRCGIYCRLPSTFLSISHYFVVVVAHNRLC